MMKKKLLSLICSLAMVTTMLGSLIVASAADAATLRVEVDAEDPANIKSGETFNVKVILDGIEGLEAYSSKSGNGTGISSLQFVLSMPENEFLASGSETVASGVVANWIEKDGGYDLSCAFSGAAANMISTVPYELVSVDFTALQDITGAQVFEISKDSVAEITKQTFANKQLSETVKFSSEDGTLSVTEIAVGPSEPAEPVVSSIEISGPDSVNESETGTYTAVVKDAEGNPMADETVTWSVDSDAAATIDSASGVLTAKSVDADATVKVIATSVTNGEVKGEKTVTIKDVPVVVTPEVTSIEITGAAEVNEGAESTYTAVVKDQDGEEMAGETVTWSVDNNEVAAIDASGKLTAKDVAEDTVVTIIATSASKAEVTATKQVTIKNAAPVVTDPKMELTVADGKDSKAGAYTFFYKAVITPGTEDVTAADVTITSGKNSRRAYVSADWLANMEGAGFTFYVGNKTADASREFSAVGTVTAGETTVTTDAVTYTTPAAE